MACWTELNSDAAIYWDTVLGVPWEGILLMPVWGLCSSLFQFQKLVTVLPSVSFASLAGKTKDSINVMVSSLLEMQAFLFPSHFSLPTHLARTWSKSQERTSCFSVTLCFLKMHPQTFVFCWTQIPNHMHKTSLV